MKSIIKEKGVRREASRDVVYYFTIRKPGSQEKWKTGIME